MTADIPALLTGILNATSDEQTAKTTISTLRAALEDAAKAERAERGTYPTWSAPKLGSVKLSPFGDWTPQVTDADAFTDWALDVADPDDAGLVTITVPVTTAAQALEALEFAGVTPTKVAGVVPDWQAVLTRCTVDVDDAGLVESVSYVDPDGNAHETVGIGAQRSPEKLTVTLDPARKREVVTAAKATADALADAAGGTEDREAVDQTRAELEQLTADELREACRAAELTTTGTKAVLSERLARHYVKRGTPASAPATTDTVVAISTAIDELRDLPTLDVLKLKCREQGLSATGSRRVLGVRLGLLDEAS